jgi:hypothetical protein
MIPFLFGIPVIALAMTWDIETVDHIGDVGSHSSLATDADGGLHISYQDVTNNDLRYARKSGGQWTIETVDSNGGQFTSIVVDDEGAAHIAYLAWGDWDLNYASNPDGAWTIETVDSTYAGLYASLALDSQGQPYIGYQKGCCGHGDLMVAWKSGDGWTIEKVDAGGWVAWYTSLAVASDGGVHVCHCDHEIGNNLRYAERRDGQWTVETVTEDAEFSSLALGTDGLVHMSYATGPVMYVHESPGGWSTETVTPQGWAARETSLAVDANGEPHVGFSKVRPSGLHYARRTGGRWTVESVDSGSVGFPSLALGPFGTLHMSYYDHSSGDLKHAMATPEVSSVHRDAGSVRQLRLSAWPLPYEGVGDVRILVESIGDLGGAVRSGNLTIYGLTGRVVRTIARGIHPRSVCEVTWDGRNEHGRRVGAGTYFLSFQGAGHDQRLKLVVVR